MNKEYVEQKCNNDCIVCSKNNPASLQTRFLRFQTARLKGVLREEIFTLLIKAECTEG